MDKGTGDGEEGNKGRIDICWMTPALRAGLEHRPSGSTGFIGRNWKTAGCSVIPTRTEAAKPAYCPRGGFRPARR